ncbi:AraC family transcriptional regulator [Acuticoccus sp. M5D2P5]|uniref:helix-turn-helix transcriptional regulator n=1 Tax=Acuticoccus kalidii TaxID=2910977 RepID=UPI001F1AEC6E|nr:AraC family transcriptional regulator [Acuticoccus kalidii]MCF3934115.1 AraC family transcriptional regulator [Acuticoccus kalidii]
MTILSIRSQDFDVSRRVEEFQNVVAAITKVNFVPDDEDSFTSETSIGITRNLIVGYGRHSASTAFRTSGHAAETDDNVMFHMPLSGSCSIEQRGGERIELKTGLVYADPGTVPGVIRFHGEPTEAFYVSIPRIHLSAATLGLNAMLRGTASLTPQWRLFFNYARSLHEEMSKLAPVEAEQCATHVQDLALMALGATREAAEVAAGRGVRAARLKSIKADVERHLTAPDLTAAGVAKRHGISPRYLRSLFASEGTSFGDFVATRRLALAHRMLSDPGKAGNSIAGIAMSAGFGDLSWFNLRFRRAYGMSPKDVRALASSGSPGHLLRSPTV